MTVQQKPTFSFSKKIQGKLLATTALTIASAMVATTAHADPGLTELPTGGQFTTGSGSISKTPILPILNVNQTTTRGVIDWKTFNIGALATVNETNHGGTTINRVNSDGGVAQIYGALKSDGKVMILDQNGVLFGANARIDVGSIIATTADLDGTNRALFDQGKSFSLTGATGGSVKNFGTINVAQSGLAAFVAPYVDNEGTINAKLGTVNLAAGKAVTVNFDGTGLISVAVSADASNQVATALVNNSGKINVQGGTVTMTANAAKGLVDRVINMDGIINATSFSTHDGKIVLDGGHSGKVSVSGTLNASRDTKATGHTAGGSITVTGENVEIASTAQLFANVTGTSIDILGIPTGLYNLDGNGDGGNVTIHGDDGVVFNGKIDVSGGLKGGDGGTASITSGNALQYDGLVNASAPKGATGALSLTAPVITIGTSTVDPIVNAAALAQTLGLSNVNIFAGTKIVVADMADLSHWFFGSLLVTSGDLNLKADEVDFAEDLVIGAGSLVVDASTINLTGKLYKNVKQLVDVVTNNQLLGKADLDGADGKGGQALLGADVNVIGSSLAADSASIQQGVDLAGSNQGKTVYVTAGNYNGNVNIYKSITLQGGLGSPTLPTDVQPLLTGTTADGTAILVAATGVTVNGFNIVGYNIGIQSNNENGTKLLNNTITGTAGAGISVDPADNITISGNNISATGSTGIIADAITHLTISGNTVSNTAGDGIYVASSDGAIIKGNTVSNTVKQADGTGNGITVKNSSNVTLGGTTAADGNTVSGAGWDGIHVEGTSADTLADNDTIQNNTVTGAARALIYGAHLTNAKIFTNTASGSDLTGYGAISTDWGSNITISGNTLSNSTAGEGIHVYDANGANMISGNNISSTKQGGIYTVGTANVTVTGNHIGKTGLVGGPGISINGASIKAAVTGNDISSATTATTGDAIDVDGSTNVSISNNYIRSVGGNGIEASGDNGVSIDTNDLSIINGYGITLSNDTGTNSITNSTSIDSTAKSAIEADSTANLTVSGNKIAQNGVVHGDGIVITGLSSASGHGTNAGDQQVGVYGNTIGKAGTGSTDGNGIHLINATGDNAGNGTVDVAGNTVSSSGANGIFLDGGASISVFSNSVFGAAVSGIEASNVYKAFIRFNDNIDGQGVSTDSGIRIDGGSDSVITDNTVKNTLTDGIRAFNSEGLVVTHNTISNIVGSGIGLAGDNDGTFNLNIITGTGRGIWVGDSSNDLITGNVISGSATYGVYLTNYNGSSDNDTITTNNITGGQYGVFVEGGAHNTTIGGQHDSEGNTITGATIDGIYATGGNTITVEKNVIGSSNNYGILINGVQGSVQLLSNTVNGTHAGTDNDGIAITGTSGAKIDGNHVNTAGWDGINVQNATDTTVSNNFVDGTQGASGIGAVNGDNGLIISGNQITNSYQYGMYIGATTGALSVDGNTVSGVTLHDGIFVTDNSQNPSITGNTIDKVGHDAISVNGGGSKATITGNFIGQNGGGIGNNGISVVNSNNSLIQSNFVANTGANGIYLDPSDGSFITGNFVTGGTNGIFVDGDSSVQVGGTHDSERNTVSGASQNGILISGGTGNSVVNNMVSGSGNADVYATGTSGATISANQLTGGVYGILADSLLGITTITQNTTNTTGSTGILVRNSSDVQVGGKGSTHVGANSSDNGNTVNSAGYNGIEIDGGERNTVSNNTVKHSGWDNVNTEGGSGVTVSYNELDNADGASGVAIIGTTGKSLVDHNTISTAKRLGVYAENADGLSITNNVISKTGTEFSSYSDFGSGIAVEATNGLTVTGNNINTASGDGISIGAPINQSASGVTGATVDGNTITNVKGDGIHGTGGIVSASSNTISKTSGDGIDVANSAGAKIDSNKIISTAQNGIRLDNSAGAHVDSNNLGVIIPILFTGTISGDGILVTNSAAADISANWIDKTVGDGINVDSSAKVNVTGNFIGSYSLLPIGRVYVNGNGIDVSNSSAAVITGNAITNVGKNGIVAYKDDGATVGSLTGINVITGAAQDGVQLSSSAGATVEANLITESGADGVDVIDSTDVNVLANIITGAGDNGVSIDPSTGLVSANLISGALNNGINVADSDGGVILLANIISGSHNDGINIDGSDNTLILLNQISKSGNDGIFVTGSNLSLIGLNTIDTAVDGISVDGGALFGLLGNTVKNATGNGISVTGVTGSLIAANNVSTSGIDGIYAYGDNLSAIYGNKVDGSGKNGIEYDHGNLALIGGNTVSGFTGGNGISVTKAAGILVDGNTVSGSDKDGIKLDRATLAIVSGNTVSGSGRNGIEAKNSNGIAIIGDNQVSQSRADGIKLSNSDLALITGNDVTKSRKNGIEATDSNGIDVSHNDISKSRNDGIKLDNADFALVSHNDINGSRDNGIELGNSYADLIRKNDINHSGNDGILIDDSSYVAAASNTVSHSRNNGIEVDGSFARNTGGDEGEQTFVARVSGNDGTSSSNHIAITNNDIRHSGNDGILAKNVGDLKVKNNDIRDGVNDGIEVKNSDYAYIGGNKVSGFYNGIELYYSSYGSIDGNTIKDVANDGIFVTGKAHDKVTNTKISHNKISDFGFGGGSDAGIQVAYADGVTISHNKINAEGNNGGDGPVTTFAREEGGSNAVGILLGVVTFGGEEGGPNKSGVRNVIVSDNKVSNTGIGLEANAFNNGKIQIKGNTFNDDTIGLDIGSGEIDLSKKANTFNGGDTAILLSPVSYTTQEQTGEGEGDNGDNGHEVTHTAKLSLFKDTIGTTVFNGQQDNYVDLENGALFNPGTPTIIDGTKATYDGVSGGLMNVTQFNAIEAKIHDFRDDQTLGLIFAAFTLDINDDLLLNKVKNGSYRSGKVGILIRGLPNTSNQGNHFFSVQDLANLAPAAGGDDNGGHHHNKELSAADFADISPAAGGDDTGSPANNNKIGGRCWSNVGGHTSVSIDLGDDGTSILSDASACK